MYRYIPFIAVIMILFFISCATTYRIEYPPSDELFITLGDDPGSESINPYIPKGYFIHVSTEYYLPIPLLGIIPLGNAQPQYVFYEEAIPKIRSMGGDALIGANVNHIPRPPVFIRFFGIFNFLFTSSTIITGQVVKRAQISSSNQNHISKESVTQRSHLNDNKTLFNTSPISNQIKSKILNIKSNFMLIDKGTNSGIKKGAQCTIYNSNSFNESNVIGEGKITSVKMDRAIIKATNDGPFNIGDFVLIEM
ncbi:hypothetical protein ACFL4L_02695 [bacterium]